ncbi:MAG: P27 family phage terminase small subunit [Oscillospiraceae bacterium]|nr:P27 family phage terminase small subunit [Oscillospiraceae bacterium]
MDKAAWIERITAAMMGVGTYRKSFDDVIDTAADIAERRDVARELFIESGGNIIVNHTNKAGATNPEQNPALRMVNDLNRDLLAYWRDLGLTPAGLKRIDEQSMKQRKKSTLEEALSGLGGKAR